MNPLGTVWAGTGRHLRLLGLVGALLALLVFAIPFVGTADAARKHLGRHNWPNSPVRHMLKQRPKLSETPSFEANLRGDVAVSGNTLETCPANLAATRRQRARHHLPQRAAAEPCIGQDNNGLDMQYVNVDPGNGRFNSSTATLTVPAGARVVKAFLYWAGDLSRGVSASVGGARTGEAAPAGDTIDNNELYRTVQLRAGGGSYATIDATAAARDGRWDSVASWYSQQGNSPGTAYQVRADVTNEINAGLATQARLRGSDESLPVTVANVQAGIGLNRYAGWNLIVVWATPTAPWRNITLFDGFDFVQVQGGQSLVVGPLDFTGFQTPASGNVDARVTVWTTEGDRTITGDYMSLGGLSNTCDGLEKQVGSDPAHPLDNFFNSSIFSDGAPVAGRTPGFDNQLGFDLTTLAVPEDTIANGATGASVCLGTNGDTYFFGGLVFDTLIKAPNLKISKSADHTNANPGDVVTYTTAVTNPSTRDPSDPLYETPVDAATNVVVADPLPSGLDFVGFTNNPNGACGYNGDTRIITCNVGTVDPDANFTYAFEATVDAVAQGDSPAALVNTGCYDANSVDQQDVVFTGCDQATVDVPPAPPAADLGVVKTVDHDIVAPGDTLTWTIVGTNHGPHASTGFVLADQLPAGVAFVSATHSPTLTCTTPPVGAGGAITCTAPRVPAAPAVGSSLTLTVVATVPPTTANGTLLLNIATVSGDQPEPTPDPHPNRDQTLTRVIVPDVPVPPVPPSPPPLPPDPSGPPELPAPPVHPPKLPSGPAGTRIALHKTATPRVVRAGRRSPTACACPTSGTPRRCTSACVTRRPPDCR